MLTRTSLKIKRLVDSKTVQVNLLNGTITGSRGAPLLVRADRNGYLTVSLENDHLLVHRIVAYAALGDEALQPGRVVVHIDGNRSNNAAANLQVLNAGQQHKTSRRPALRWRVTDLEQIEIARFASRDLAEEYARWKFGHTDGILGPKY